MQGKVEPDFETVYCVTDLWGGQPVKGVASFQGEPCFFESIFDDKNEEYSDFYLLTPLPEHIFRASIEDFEIFLCWKASFHSDKTGIETHPALLQDRPRHEQFQAIVDDFLRKTAPSPIKARAKFVRGDSRESAIQELNVLRVRWEATGESAKS